MSSLEPTYRVCSNVVVIVSSMKPLASSMLLGACLLCSLNWCLIILLVNIQNDQSRLRWFVIYNFLLQLKTWIRLESVNYDVMVMSMDK